MTTAKKVCQWCSRSFFPNPFASNWQRYCDDDCRYDAHKSRHGTRKHEPEYTCKQCGATARRRGVNGRMPVYCTACAKERSRLRILRFKRKRRPKQCRWCIVCGRFLRRHRAKFCNRRCFAHMVSVAQGSGWRLRDIPSIRKEHPEWLRLRKRIVAIRGMIRPTRGGPQRIPTRAALDSLVAASTRLSKALP
jgi:hypothetical protein